MDHLTDDDELVARAFRRDRLADALHRSRPSPCARPLVAGLVLAALTAGGVAAPGLAEWIGATGR